MKKIAWTWKQTAEYTGVNVKLPLEGVLEQGGEGIEPDLSVSGCKYVSGAHFWALQWTVGYTKWGEFVWLAV
jgi:hypothetical protein